MLRTVALLAAGLTLGLYVRAQIGADFTLLGQDSVFYLYGAEELRAHHSYGSAADPRYCRLPGYSAFLATVALVAGEPAEAKEAFYRDVKHAQWALDLATCLVVFFVARRLAGAAAAWPAFALALINPMPLLFAPAILSETLATALTAFALALMLAAVTQQRRARPLWSRRGR